MDGPHKTSLLFLGFLQRLKILSNYKFQTIQFWKKPVILLVINFKVKYQAFNLEKRGQYPHDLPNSSLAACLGYRLQTDNRAGKNRYDDPVSYNNNNNEKLY